MRDARSRPRSLGLALMGVALAAGACTAPARSSGQRLDGTRIEVMAAWAEVEQQRFARVLAVFERETGAEVTYTPQQDDLPAALKARIAEGRAPDVAFLPQPGLLRETAAAGHLVPLDATTARQVRARFPAVLADLATYRGRSYGVWFKAANKSLVWYRMSAFERQGLVPPKDLDGFVLLADRLAAAGTRPFAVSALDGWTLTDWFENLYLRLAGLQAYDELAAHRRPWTDPSVGRTLELMARLLDPAHLAGGTAGALRTGFTASVGQVFGPSPQAAMLTEGDFVAGVISGDTTSRLEVDADVFPFPPAAVGAPVVVGGGDVAVQLRPSPAASAFLAFLATPEAAAAWASVGGFVSPNLDLDLSVYPDEVSRMVARRLLEAGDGFRFDLSDLQPASFGASETGGMFAELRSFLVDRDVATTTARLEAEAAAAWSGAP